METAKGEASSQWIALAISEDEKMGNDTVIECVFPSKAAPAMYLSHNTPSSNVRQLEVHSPFLIPMKHPSIPGYLQTSQEYLPRISRWKAFLFWRLDSQLELSQRITEECSENSSETREYRNPLQLLPINIGKYRLMWGRGPADDGTHP